MLLQQRIAVTTVEPLREKHGASFLQRLERGRFFCNVHGAVIMTEVIARVHLVHLMNAD